MKAVQDLSGGSASAQHLSALIWHAGCSVLVYCLCWQATRQAFWSLFAAIVFVLYPHHAFTANWLAAQNAVMQSTLTLAAVLCYTRASGLVLHQGAAGLSSRKRSDREAPHGHAKVAEAKACGSLRKGWFAAATILFVAALFARENAVVFPVLAVAFDLAFGGRSHVRARLRTHALLIALAVGLSHHVVRVSARGYDVRRASVESHVRSRRTAHANGLTRRRDDGRRRRHSENLDRRL